MLLHSGIASSVCWFDTFDHHIADLLVFTPVFHLTLPVTQQHHIKSLSQTR